MLVGRESLLESALQQQRHAEREQRVGVSGAQLQARSEGFLGSLDPTSLQEADTEVGPGVGMGRIARHRRTMKPCCERWITGRALQHPEIGQSIGLVGVEFESSLEGGGRFWIFGLGTGGAERDVVSRHLRRGRDHFLPGGNRLRRGAGGIQGTSQSGHALDRDLRRDGLPGDSHGAVHLAGYDQEVDEVDGCGFVLPLGESERVHQRCLGVGRPTRRLEKVAEIGVHIGLSRGEIGCPFCPHERLGERSGGTTASFEDRHREKMQDFRPVGSVAQQPTITGDGLAQPAGSVGRQRASRVDIKCWPIGEGPAGLDQSLEGCRHAIDGSRPIPGCRLMEQPHRRIPWGPAHASTPSPIRHMFEQ